MAGDCGLNALSLLPENVLPQWQQKIALRAENPSGHNYCHKKAHPMFCRVGLYFALESIRTELRLSRESVFVDG